METKNNTKMGKLIDKLLDEYVKMFHDTLPLVWLNLSDEETVELLVDCLINKKRYKSNYQQGILL